MFALGPLLARQEPLPDWLLRVQWLAEEDGKVSLTQLGEAVLRSLDEGESELDSGTSVVLGSGDQLAYAQVVGRISQIEADLLADPYFRLDDLHRILTLTTVTRILTGPKNDALPGLAAAMDLLPEESVEVRVSDEFHDRYAFPPSGPILSLGTSLSGVGKRVAVMTTLRDGADEIRKVYEALWRKASPVKEAARG